MGTQQPQSHPAALGLAAVIEHYLGISLAKEHSAVDWSKRPLPEPWLEYAALDVEVLAEVRNLMGIDLARAATEIREQIGGAIASAALDRIDTLTAPKA